MPSSERGCAGPDPLVSIVVPTFNRWPRLRRTLQSLQEQRTDAPYEVIVVDDGSTDGTPEALSGMRAAALTYVRQENRERGAARNAGATLARGKYCNFFDSDDLCLSNHVEEAVRFASRQADPEVFHTGYEVRDESGHVDARLQSEEPANDRLLHGNCLNCNPVFVRSDVARTLPFSEDRELSGTEDWLLWLQLAARYPFYGRGVVTSILVHHGERSVVNATESSLLARRDRLVRYLRDDPVFMQWRGGELSRIRARMTLYAALHLSQGGRPARGLYHLIDAVRQAPRLAMSRQAGGALKHIALNYLGPRRTRRPTSTLSGEGPLRRLSGE
jgi:glycosyltransferase involved in cell wall biosynthesis